MLELLNLRAVGSIRENITLSSLYLLYPSVASLKFNSISLFFFQNTRPLYKQDFLEHFSNKDLKTLNR